MKICILGGFGGVQNEGMKNVAYNLQKVLAEGNDVLCLNPSSLLTRSFWRELSRFDPQVIHYVSGPSLKSFVVMKMIAIRHPYARSIMSATHPKLSGASMRIARAIRPDLLLVESKQLEDSFKKGGFNVLRVNYTGIDVDRFSPVSAETKSNLKKKWNVPMDRYVVVHVGHNCSVLGDLQGKAGIHSICVIPTDTTNEMTKKLDDAGCTVIKGFIPNIEEIYQMADCYLFFSTEEIDCIHLPLSVLEAMACNIPVVSTKFGALPELFEEGRGVLYVDGTIDSLKKGIEEIRAEPAVHTRERVLFLSHESIRSQMLTVYRLNKSR